jgi:Methyltransferase FkbM domain
VRNKPIRDLLLRGIGALDLHAVRRIDRQSLAELIGMLHPIDAGPKLVRVGPDGDGGYLVPDDLDAIDYAFSPGVSNESGFEAALAARGIGVFLADYSVDGPAEANPRFVFDKKFIGSFTDATHMTFDEWKRAAIADHDGDLLLQMDIEGAEFETILNMPEALQQQFRVMVVEFHYLHQLWNKPWFLLVRRVFEKLLATHSVVHIHPNNCCGSFKSRGLELPRVAEFTLLRNDRVEKREYVHTFPHPLDRDNTRKPTLVLPACWYR